MKKLWTSTLIALAISLFFTACSFKLGDNTSAAKPKTTDKTKADVKSKNDKSTGLRTEDDSTTDEDNSDSESDDSPEFDVEIKRTFQIGEKPEGSPEHGDYTIIKELENGGTVGSLHLFKPREAIFLIWDGEVIAGPLTTVKQVEEAYEMLGRQSADEHQTRMDIMKNYPTGQNKRRRVYDSKGNLLREEKDF